VVDFSETRMLQMARQHNMTANSVSQQSHSGEAHSHLKSYPCLFRYHAYGTTSSDQLNEPVEQCDRQRTFVCKVAA